MGGFMWLAVLGTGALASHIAMAPASVFDIAATVTTATMPFFRSDSQHVL
jgi:hypothetical protein